MKQSLKQVKLFEPNTFSINDVESTLTQTFSGIPQFDYNILFRKKRTGATWLKEAKPSTDVQFSNEIGIMVYHDGNRICGWTEDDNEKAVRVLCESLREAISKQNFHIQDVIPERGFVLKRDLKILDPDMPELKETVRKGHILDVQDVILNKRVSSINDLKLRDLHSVTTMMLSNGLHVEYEDSVISVECTYFFRLNNDLKKVRLSVRNRHFDKLLDSLKRIQIPDKKIPSETRFVSDTPVILDPQAAACVLQLFCSCINPDTDHFEESYLKEKIGRKIAHSQLDIFDDGLLEGGLYTVPYDDEGVNSQTTPIVNEGKLRNFLTDHRRAIELRTSFTGNASRPLGKCGIIEPTNFLIVPSKRVGDTLLDKIPNTLLLSNLSVRTFNPGTGDFTGTANGYRISEGEPVARFDSVAVESNLATILQHLEHLGGDMDWYGHFGSPSLAIGKSITIKG